MADFIARSVTIAPGRLRPWIDNFKARHGACHVVVEDQRVRLSASDGAEAIVTVPFPPLDSVGGVAESGDPSGAVDALLLHIAQPRRLGAVLVRKGGFAVGVFDGPRLIASKVGSSYVQGKTKAGGWSQQRYARRRDNQSRQAYAAAADEAVRVILPHLHAIEAVVPGGDKGALAAVFDDPRLSDLRRLLLPLIYPVPDPRLRVLAAFPEQFLGVTIELNSLA